MRTIVNGQFDASSGTTLGQTATQACNDGYTFTGNESVSCTASGWDGAIGTCTAVGMFNRKLILAQIMLYIV